LALVVTLTVFLGAMFFILEKSPSALVRGEAAL
jgi:hypothetical protein